MHTEPHNTSKFFQASPAIICFGLIFISFYGLGSTVYPLVISWILAYMLQPVLQYIRKYLPQPFGALLISAFLSFLLLMIFFKAIPLLASELNEFLLQLPNNAESAIRFIENMLKEKGWDTPLIHEMLFQKTNDWIKSIDISSITLLTHFASTAATHIVDALTMVINIFLIPIFFFYWAIQNITIKNIITILPPDWRIHAKHILTESHYILSGYLRGQGTVIGVLMVLYAAYLYILNIHFGILVGIITGLLQIIPYVGFCIGLMTALIMGIATETSWIMLLKVITGYVIITNIEGFVLTPKLVGGRLGLNPLVTLLAIIVASHYFGIVGIIIAVPTSAWIYMCLKYLVKQCRLSWGP